MQPYHQHVINGTGSTAAQLQQYRQHQMQLQMRQQHGVNNHQQQSMMNSAGISNNFVPFMANDGNSQMNSQQRFHEHSGNQMHNSGTLPHSIDTAGGMGSTNSAKFNMMQSHQVSNRQQLPSLNQSQSSLPKCSNQMMGMEEDSQQQATQAAVYWSALQAQSNKGSKSSNNMVNSIGNNNNLISMNSNFPNTNGMLTPAQMQQMQMHLAPQQNSLNSNPGSIPNSLQSLVMNGNGRHPGQMTNMQQQNFMHQLQSRWSGSDVDTNSVKSQQSIQLSQHSGLSGSTTHSMPVQPQPQQVLVVQQNPTIPIPLEMQEKNLHRGISSSKSTVAVNNRTPQMGNSTNGTPINPKNKETIDSINDQFKKPFPQDHIMQHTINNNLAKLQEQRLMQQLQHYVKNGNNMTSQDVLVLSNHSENMNAIPSEEHINKKGGSLKSQKSKDLKVNKGKKNDKSKKDLRETESESPYEKELETRKSSSKVQSSNPAENTSKTFLQGSFAGGWQSNRDLEDRHGVIINIVKLVEKMNPHGTKSYQNLPSMAKRLEEHLYKSAKTKEEYLDELTLTKRLEMLAQYLEVNKSSADVSKKESKKKKMKHNNGNNVGELVCSPPVSAQSQEGLYMMKQPDQQTSLNLCSEALQVQAQVSNHVDTSDEMDVPLNHLRWQFNENNMANELLKSMKIPQMPNGGKFPVNNNNISFPVSRQGSMQNLFGTCQIQEGNRNQISMSTNSQIAFQNGQASAEKKKVIKQQQQRLLLLRHASKCTQGAKCKTKFCEEMVILWKHMKNCRNKDCKTDHCLSSRCVLNHYQKCRDQNKTATCEVCAPVIKHVKGRSKDRGPHEKDNNEQVEPFDSLSKDIELNTTNTQRLDMQNECLQRAQKKLQEQIKLFHHLQQQQSQLLKKEKALLQEQQGQTLRHHQNLLQKLQKKFHDDKLLVQKELQRQSLILEFGNKKPHENSQSDSKRSMQVLEENNGEEKASFVKIKKDTETLSKNHQGKNKSKGEGKQLNKNKKQVKSKSLNNSEKGNKKRALHPASSDDCRTLKKKKKLASKSAKEEKSNQSKLITVEKSKNISKNSVSIKGKSKSSSSQLKSKKSGKEADSILSPKMKDSCLNLVKKLIDDPSGWVFKDAVDPTELDLPDYFDVIKKPMDLTNVSMKLSNGEYKNLESFAEETRLVFENAIIYNGKESDVGEMALSLLNTFESAYNRLKMS